jgi:hypothetical protein
MFSLGKWITRQFTEWLTYESDRAANFTSLTNYERLCDEIKPGDIILVEGHSRVSHIIKLITQSPWTHSMLYLGNYHQLSMAGLAPISLSHYALDPHAHLIIEAVLGEGTIVTPLQEYKEAHLRICRPSRLTLEDRNKVIQHAMGKIGYQYDIRQLFDLARFLLPYSLIPRRWRSSLFRYHAGASTQTICSSMLAEAFISVDYPVLPVIENTEQGLRFYKRNTKLFTPQDFDYSPYFDIIKYPFIGIDEIAAYRSLPWDDEGLICNAQGDCTLPLVDENDNGDIKQEIQQGV